MTAIHAGQLVDAYLQQLENELTDVSPNRRNEILDEIRRHIAEERNGLDDESDADVMNLLERLGDPSEIAAEARGAAERRHTPATSRSFGTFEVLALVLMLLAWPVGAVLLWLSKAWTTRQKLLGTLVPPGGYPGVLLVMSTFRWVKAALDTGTGWGHVAVGALLFTVSLLALTAPIGMTIYLATRLRLRPLQ